MEQNWAVPGVSRLDTGAYELSKPTRTGGQRLTVIAGLVAIVALAASVWVYATSQREILRLATEVAQLRLSVDLYRGQQPQTGASSETYSGSSEILNLRNRLAILEDAWRSQTQPIGGQAIAGPAITTPATAAAPSGPIGDCIPEGTRFLVTSGDSYPICGTTAVVDVAAVGTADVSFTDGTIIAAGGNAILSPTSCSLAVMSAGADGMTGYAELRVSC